MNALKFKQIIYLISITVIVTVAAQVYTNVQNYKVNKQRFERDVQQALDLAVESYYADRARNEVIIFRSSADVPDSLMFQSDLMIQGKFNIDSSINISTSIQGNASWQTYMEKRDSIRQEIIRDSISGLEFADETKRVFRMNPDSITSIKVLNHYSMSTDSIELQLMAKKILASLRGGSLDFERLQEYLQKELDRKVIDVKYTLVHSTPREVFSSIEGDTFFELTTYSKSTYLPRDEKLEIRYENASLAILKRGAFDLLISLLIIIAVVGSLLYLYKVINEQKQLAEIKNDLISNITHEFKTPIATISTAIEGISIFNEANDPNKTKKYLGISSDQLKKLNTMVEKLLETATLDSDEIELNKEPVDVVQMSDKLIEKFDVVKGEKALGFECDLKERVVDLDPFHMENAISNLIDNALKYGGSSVNVSLRAEGERTIWEIRDNGGGINKQHQAHIFDKFYRIPTGNVHDVKGFGIGLYYTKAMIQKHGGRIDLKSGDKETVFTISI